MNAQMMELRSEAGVERVLGEPCALIFKHSTRCGVSARARAIVEQFAEEHPSIPVYVVLVIEFRHVSNYLADELGVRHQSPQAILVQAGTVAWQGSHFEISERALKEVLASVACDGAKAQ